MVEQPAPATIDYGDPALWSSLTAQLFARCQLRVTGLSGYYECPPQWRWSVTLKDFDLWLVLRGTGLVTVANHHAAFPVHAGTMMFLRPGDRIAAEQDPADPLTVVASHMDFFDVASGEIVTIPERWLPNRKIPFTDATAVERALMRITRLQDSDRRLASIEESAALLQALVEIYRQDAANHGLGDVPRDHRLERVITRMRQTPHHRYSLAEAAALAGLSPDYFSRLFAREMHMPFRDFAIRLRLERSRYMLEETDLGIGEIARHLGYSDIYLFSRQFKDHYGCSPRQVRHTGP